jgi:hypothetical protein
LTKILLTGNLFLKSRGSSVVERSPEKAGVGSSILPPGNQKFENSNRK